MWGNFDTNGEPIWEERDGPVSEARAVGDQGTTISDTIESGQPG